MSSLARARGQAHLSGEWLRTVPRAEPKPNAPRWNAAAPPQSSTPRLRDTAAAEGTASQPSDQKITAYRWG